MTHPKAMANRQRPLSTPTGHNQTRMPPNLGCPRKRKSATLGAEKPATERGEERAWFWMGPGQGQGLGRGSASLSGGGCAHSGLPWVGFLEKPQAWGRAPRVWGVLATGVPEVGFPGRGMPIPSTDTDSSWDSVCPQCVLCPSPSQDGPGTPKLPQWPNRNNAVLQEGRREKETKALGTFGNPRGAALDAGVSRGHWGEVCQISGGWRLSAPGHKPTPITDSASFTAQRDCALSPVWARVENPSARPRCGRVGRLSSPATGG